MLNKKLNFYFFLEMKQNATHYLVLVTQSVARSCMSRSCLITCQIKPLQTNETSTFQNLNKRWFCTTIESILEKICIV